jgi:SagB-type dehydrogenase family enzyme
MNMNAMTQEQHRWFLSDRIRMEMDWGKTDQNQGVRPPLLQKPVPEDARRIDLTSPEQWGDVQEISLLTAIFGRQSRRAFTGEQLTLNDLSFLLWATQGVREVAGPFAAPRMVPSAGCRHSFETYLAVLNVQDVEPGIYRFLPLEHQIVLVREYPNLGPALVDATLGQKFCGNSAVTFIWTTIPYRTEWRYGLAAHRVILIDAGHVGQNLYLACEAIGAGTCTVGAYNQESMDELLGVDGDNELTVYLAPVGRVERQKKPL